MDKAACSVGMLIYTVDTTIPSGQGPVRVQNARPNSCGCDGDVPEHRYLRQRSG
ncbi:hypothetical protein ACH41H_49945 [Streptomyces sp. NPDC020800]|uniref:hypothetical protein n=1 Tax=Streptomyces sp. NPDC020800 TaxID=3365092 RepID=UPI0037A7FBD5